MSGSLFGAYINPLKFFAVEDHGNDANIPTPAEILDFVIAPGTDGSPEAIASRCRELVAQAPGIFAAPSEPHILQKLIWPLRHAKGSYALGNFLGTIALAGMVSEMVAITYFDATDFSINGTPMDDRAQRDVWGNTFEKQGQDRRVKILHAYGVIDDSTKAAFDDIRVVRRRYLHLASQGHETLDADARKAFVRALELVVRLVGQGFNQGSIVLSPVMTKYLNDRGLLKSRSSAEEPEPVDDSSAEGSPGDGKNDEQSQ